MRVSCFNTAPKLNTEVSAHTSFTTIGDKQRYVGGAPPVTFPRLSINIQTQNGNVGCTVVLVLALSPQVLG